MRIDDRPRICMLTIFPLLVLGFGGERALDAQSTSPNARPHGDAPAAPAPHEATPRRAAPVSTNRLPEEAAPRPALTAPRAPSFAGSSNRNPWDVAPSPAPAPGPAASAPGPGGAAPGPAILVYEDGAVHRLAEAAARKVSIRTVVADKSTFNGLLAGGSWDAVAVDCPSVIPGGGWGPLSTYVSQGGRAILSFWDWVDVSTPEAVTRNAVFGVPNTPAGLAAFSWNGNRLVDSDTTPVFNGTSRGDTWHDHWGLDGALFHGQGLFGVATLGGADPVLVRGPSGRTFAAPVLDEAGDAWLADGSGVRLWQNMLQALLAPRILVYSEDPTQELACKAALAVSPGGREVVGASTFNAELSAGGWDVVALDCPGRIPTGGWDPLVSHVKAGGRAVLSFFDWDGDQGRGTAALDGAFRVFPITSTPFTWTGKSLISSGPSGTFGDVSMPNSSWQDVWVDDGDLFIPLGSAVGLAHVGDPTQPVMVKGNGGRTIAAPLLDEAGAPWVAGGSAQRVWENMIQEVAPGLRILVYDQDGEHSFAYQAALEESPLGTTRADQNDFNAVLADRGWDVVLLDVPGDPPSGGWAPLLDYVSHGGKTVLSYWDWDDNAGYSSAGLAPAFEVVPTSDLSLSTEQLFSSGTSSVLAGVPAAGNWHNHWGDDGDHFQPLGNAVGLVHLGSPSSPVMVWGNGGRTVASFVIDEAGDSLLVSDGAIRLWKNLIDLVTSPEASCSFRAGTLGLDPADFDCTSAPVVGTDWTSTIATTPLVGTTTLSTIVALGLGGPVQGFTAFGYEVLALPPYVMDVRQGAHQIAIPSNPGLVGLSITAQGGRVELGHGKLSLVLTNSQDLVLGL